MTWVEDFRRASGQPFRVKQTDIVNGRDDRPGIGQLAGVVRLVGDQLALIFPGGTGFLLPQLTTAERDAIASPQAGTLIWNTTTVQAEIYDGSAWGPFWSPAEAASVGLSTTWPAGSAVPTGGGTASFELPLPSPATFVCVNALEYEVSNITPGAGISTFDLALYDTEANRDAGTFSSADPGIQFLAPALTQAAPGPATVPWAVLGRIQGSLNGSGNPVLWGLVRNNDVANVFDGTIAVEAYGLRGSRAT